MAVAEIGFDAVGQRWTLRLGFGALCSIEEAFDGEPFMKVMERVFPDLSATAILDPEKLLVDSLSVSLSDLRTVFVHALSERHPTATEADVNRIVDDIGLAETGMLLRKAMSNDTGGDDKPNPRKRRVRRKG